jgi:hypothetical protein
VQILPRLGTNHPYANGIQNCTNKGQPPFPLGDNSKRVKVHRKHLKIFFSRTSRANSIKHSTNYHKVKGIQNCSNQGPGPLQMGDYHKNAKIG